MKTRDILGLVILGTIAWFFLKPKLAKAEEISEVPEILEVPKPEVYTVLPEPITTIPYPKSGFYFAELIPLTTIAPTVVAPEEVKKEEVIIPKSIADIMEAIVEAAKR